MRSTSSAAPRQDTIIDALLWIVAERGMEQVSVREVATAAGVSIGTVQHYFRTKDAMLAAAYDEVVNRIRSRLDAVKLGTDVRKNLSAVLTELLPLDERRRVECRVHLAFAARAATRPDMAKTQARALAELHDGVTDAFARGLGRPATRAQCVVAAHAAIAVADGLALHAVSADGWVSGRRQKAALEMVLDALIP